MNYQASLGSKKFHWWCKWRSRNNAPFGCGSSRAPLFPFYSQLGSSSWDGGTVNDQWRNHCPRRIEIDTGVHCWTWAISSPPRLIYSPLIHKYLSDFVRLSSSSAALGDPALGFMIEERGRVDGQRVQRPELKMVLSSELYKAVGRRRRRRRCSSRGFVWLENGCF